VAPPGRIVALAALLAVAALAVASAATASERHPTLNELEHEVMCPTCHTTLDVSDAPVADRIRAFIRRRIAAGDTKSQIEERLVVQVGEAVLAAPPRHGFGLLAWLLPLAAVAGGALAVGAVVAVARSRGTPRDEPPPLDPVLARRLDAELARLEP
jgi:cytochrome c-type biogenesis protein CcmH